jgi:hypothetical protein
MTTESSKPVYPEPQHFPEVIVQAEPTPPPAATGQMPPVVNRPESAGPIPLADYRCVRCGSSNLTHGYVIDYGDKFEQVRFAPKRTTLRWLNSLFNLRPWRRLLPLNADACRDCGAVMLVVSPYDLREADPR